MRTVEETLGIRLAYCLGWETLSDVRPFLASIRRYWEGRQAFSPVYRWVFELYEEQPTTVAESRMIANHIVEQVTDKNLVRTIVSHGIRQLPEESRVAARRHPIVQGIESRARKSRFSAWQTLFPPTIRRPAIPEILPGIERESDFLDFLSLPGFRRAFEKYWHFGPRDRKNRETRALVSVAASVLLILGESPEESGAPLKRALAEYCGFSTVTVAELFDLFWILPRGGLSANKVAVRLVADTHARDARRVSLFGLELERRGIPVSESSRLFVDMSETLWGHEGKGS